MITGGFIVITPTSPQDPSDMRQGRLRFKTPKKMCSLLIISSIRKYTPCRSMAQIGLYLRPSLWGPRNCSLYRCTNILGNTGTSKDTQVHLWTHKYIYGYTGTYKDTQVHIRTHRYIYGYTGTSMDTWVQLGIHGYALWN